MIARCSIVLPFHIAVPLAATFSVYQYPSDGYLVRVYPPEYSVEQPAQHPDEIAMNEQPAVLADKLRIDFVKESFDRSQDGPMDPPEHVINGAVRSLLLRLRQVTRGAFIRMPDFPKCAWRIEYRTDDDQPLDRADGLRRARGALPLMALACVGLTPDIWNTIHDLDSDFEPEPWDTLLLDAQDELPSVGTSIVLAATALEVFISRLLDRLAQEPAVPSKLWSWINNRTDYRQEPTVYEQYDALLQFFTGHSLKENNALWEIFQSLKTARNTFVHEGVAKIKKTPVTPQRASELIFGAGAIIDAIRPWVPPSIQWRTYEHKIAFSFTKALGPISPPKTPPELAGPTIAAGQLPLSDGSND